MERRVLTLLALVAFLLPASSSRASVPLHLWSERFGDLNLQRVQAVAVDASGNIFITGHFNGPISLGGGTLFGNGGYDIFLAKYNSDGNHLWSQSFGGAGIDEGLGLAVDSGGNVIMTGHIFNTVDLGGGNLAAQGDDIFLAKYSANGSHVWSQFFGDTQTDYGYSVAVDDSDNIFLTGRFNGTVNFGGGDLTGPANDDIFLAKFNANGVHQWSQQFGYLSNDRGYGVAADASGNVFLAGAFFGPVDFGGGPLGGGSLNIVLAKFNGSGTHLWSKSFGSTGDDEGRSVCVDASGNVFLTGLFVTSADFGGGAFTSAGGDDAFLAKFDAGGTHLWSRAFGSTGDDQGNAVAADSSGNVFVTGQFEGNADFGGGAVLSAGGFDIFLAKFDGSGGHRFSLGFGDTGDDYGNAVVVDGDDNTVMSGSFMGTVDFGGGDLTSAGIDDIFLAKFSGLPVDPLITAIADIPNDQGGEVLITFDASAHDTPLSPNGIVQYEAYRRQDAPPAAPGGIAPASPGTESPRLAPLDAGWTYVGAVPAHGKAEYSMIASTIGDSTVALGPYYSVYFIRAATASPYVFCDSYPDSGYSLDNLSPAVPTDLVLAGGQLSWSQPSTPDLDYFTVYGSDFYGLGGATVVDYSVAANLDVSASPYVFYYVTATDFSGNESDPAWLTTSTGVGETPRRYVLSVSNFPNPFRPRTTVRYTVPERSRVTVAVYDARGGRVATLVDRELKDAGAYRAEWNGRSDSGTSVPSGVYFARIEQGGSMVSKKMILVD